jgi:hypothetical protein
MTRERGGPAIRWSLLAVAVVALAAAVAGCSSGDSDDGGSEAGSDHAADGGARLGEEAAPTDPSGDASASNGADLAVDTVALSQAREVIRTGRLDLSVDDVEDAAADVRRITDAAKGFVADEQVHAADAEVSITVRVPTDDFDGVRAQIAELGEVVEQTVEAEDVTAEMVDVETRIESLQKSVDRLQAMLGQSGDVAQLASVEGELARREQELEAMLGQQRVLEDQVSLGTLTVELSEDEPPKPDEDAAGFRDGLRLGWVWLVDGGRAALAALGFLLPLAVPALVIGVPLRWWILRRRAVPPAAPTN